MIMYACEWKDQFDNRHIGSSLERFDNQHIGSSLKLELINWEVNLSELSILLVVWYDWWYMYVSVYMCIVHYMFCVYGGKSRGKFQWARRWG